MCDLEGGDTGDVKDPCKGSHTETELLHLLWVLTGGAVEPSTISHASVIPTVWRGKLQYIFILHNYILQIF